MREFYRLCEDSPVLSRRLVQIALLDGTRVLYLAVHEGRERFALSASVGDRYPASATAVGTALLAGLTDAELEARFADDRDLVVFTDRSTSSLAGLLEKVRRARGPVPRHRRLAGAPADRGGGPHPRRRGVAAGRPNPGTASAGTGALGLSPDRRSRD